MKFISVRFFKDVIQVAFKHKKCDPKKFISDSLAISETHVNRAYIYSQERKEQRALTKILVPFY